jgi:hypothetical protein
VLVPVLVVAVASVVESVGDNGDDGNDFPSVSLGVLVLAFVIVVASAPLRTISKGREKEKRRAEGCVSVVCVSAKWVTAAVCGYT